MPTTRLFAGVLTIACSWAAVTHAAEISIPELGVELVDVPSGVEKPAIQGRIDGWTATLHIGKATLKIDRFEDIVPSGSDIRNDRFRAAQEPPEYAAHPLPRGQRTGINGLRAWTSTYALRSGVPGGKDALYRSVTYVVADQHVYSAAAYEIGAADTPPADFVAAVRIISDLKFVAVDRSGISNTGPLSGLIRKPFFNPSSQDYYPAAAKRHGETGVVDLEFSIDGKGHARDISQIYADTTDLGASAHRLLTDLHFYLPSGWEANGYQKLRFTLEVQYFLMGSSHPCGNELPPRVSDAQLALICGSR